MVIEDGINLVSEAMEKKDVVPKSFLEWLIKNKKYFLFIISLLPLAMKYYGQYFGSINGLKELSNNNHLLIAITAALQCLFIIFAIFLPMNEMCFQADPDKKKKSRVPGTNNNSADVSKKKLDSDEIKANTALMQFKSAWTFLWTSWLLLYLTLFIKYLNLSATASLFSFYISNSALFMLLLNLYKDFFHIENILQIFLNLFNNMAPAVFMICYLIFAKITVPDNKSNGSSQNQTSSSNSSAKFPLWLAIVLSVIILLLFGIIDFIFQGNEITKYASSIMAGIAMAFFLGRLNNKFINPPIFIIVCLYAYMAIQTLFPFWSGIHDDFIVLLSANLAFIFKIVLYLFMLWIFRSGRLLFYFKNERKLMGSVKDDWENFESSGVLITLPTTNNKISGNN